MVKILLVGNGAREHVIAETLEKSRHRPKIYAYMKITNPGILTYAEGVELGSYTSTQQIADFAKKASVEFAIIGPEEPLKHGVVDALAKEGIPCPREMHPSTLLASTGICLIAETEICATRRAMPLVSSLRPTLLYTERSTIVSPPPGTISRILLSLCRVALPASYCNRPLPIS